MAKPKNPKPETYHVAGENIVLDHAPGETFDAVLEPILEERLIESGNLARGPAPDTTDKTTGAGAGEKE
jgi:hypothetical protein